VIISILKGVKKCKIERLKALFIIAFFLMFRPLTSFGTHISGAEITYQWISGNTFEVTLTLYRDCSGIAAPTNPVIKYSSASCNKKLTLTLSKVPGTGQEITHPCSTSVTKCQGGTLAGIQEYQYRATVTLPAQCTDWVFGYDICCRNCAITTLNFNGCANVPATYVEATLNNVAAPSNSSPIFTNIPVTFVCIGQPFLYNHGAYDSNGDSIIYSLIPPRSASGTNVTYQSNYSATKPISSSPLVTLNPVNGDISMHPTNIEVSVMAVLVREYRNGVLIGSVVRDMEIWTQPCSNLLPTATGINGTNNFSIVACPGKPLDINIYSADGNAGQTVNMEWNNGIPNAVFYATGSPYATGHLIWTPTLAQARPQPYNFTITVNDNNCPIVGIQTYSYSIKVPPMSVSATSTSSGCSNPGTGTATALPAGTAPFTYSWNPGGSTTQTASNLAPGNYTTTVTESNGCTASVSTIVNSKIPVTASVAGITNVTCNGSNNGSATINAGGGTMPYSYSWNPSGGNAAYASNLSPGNYNVTVTDANACTTVVPVTISQPSPLTATVGSLTNILCNGSKTGSASINVSGGTAPYTFLWSPGGKTTSSVTGLQAGNHAVLITDAQGCTKSLILNINQPIPMQVTVAATNSTCGNSNGTASVDVVGGTAPYTFQWANGSTASTLSGLSAGAYSVVVSDANGCTYSDVAGVSNIEGPTTILSTITQCTCYGDQNGSAEVSVNAGTPPFSYQWTPTGGNAAIATGLSAGNYVVTVTDAYNCKSALSVDITSPNPINISLWPTSPGCFGGNSGSVQAAASGGTSPYNYSWMPGNFSGTLLSNVQAGNYQVTVTDNSGCQKTASVQVNEPSQLSGSVYASTAVSCFGGSNGSALVNASGGSAPYNYSWSPTGGNLPSASGLSSGNYSVLITDVNNCTTTFPVNIIEPAEVISSMNSTQILCAGDTNGVLNVSVNGGTLPYNFNWLPEVSTTSSATNLPAGNYKVTITDLNGCTAFSTAAINEPSPVSANILTLNHVLCHGGSDGSVAIAATGGNGPYNYSWPSQGINSPTINALNAGMYSVIITDANNCTLNNIIAINEPESLQDSIGASTNVTCYGGTNGSASIIAFGGTEPYNYVWNPTLTNTSDVSNLSAGNYNLIVTDTNGCTVTLAIPITQPTPIATSSNTVPATCGMQNGSVTVNSSGGNPPYTYAWNTGGSNSNSLNSLSAGTYSVTITDQVGCSTSATENISNLSTMTLANSVSHVTCQGGNNGSASVSVSGGTPPFQYSWSPNNCSTTQATGLTAGNYTVTVTDGNACLQILSLAINEPAPLTSSIVTSQNVSCNGGNDGSATVNSNGGTAPYSYQWNNSGINSASIDSLNAGLYSVTTTDAVGCTSNTQITINEPAIFSNSSTSIPTACGTSNGSATLSVSGGSPPYNYAWQPGGMNSASVNNISAGSYSVIITDSKNCTQSANVSVSNINGPSVNVFALNNVSCSGGNNGNASVSVSNGTPPYSYQWLPVGGSLSSASNLTAGNYSIQINDANNCITSLQLTITEPSPTMATANATPAKCNGSANGSVSVTVNGGTGPYQYLWSNGAQTQLVDSLTPGIYSVTITDFFGCTFTSSTTVIQPSGLTLTKNMNNISCSGDLNGSATVQPSGGTSPYYYQWLPSGGNAATAINLGPGIYTAYVHDDNGCVDSAQFTFTSPAPVNFNIGGNSIKCYGGNDGQISLTISGGTAPYSYQWNTGDTTQTISNLSPGNYSVISTDQKGCTNSISLNLSQPDEIISASTNPSPICIGQQTTLTANVTGGVPPYSYYWSNGVQTVSQNISPKTTTTYSLIVTDANGCSSTATNISVAVNSPLVVAPPSTDTICEGNSITLQANASGGNGGPYNYSWDNGSIANSISVSPAQTTTYTLSITDNCTLMPAIVSIPVIVKPKPNPNFIPNPVTGCAPVIANFTDQTSVCNLCTYAWEFGDGTTSNGITGNHIYTSPGQYTVTHIVTDGIGCMGSVEIPAAVIVYPLALAGFSVNEETVPISNPIVSFFDQSTNANQWSWDFGDKSGYSKIENPSYSFKEIGTYEVSLIIKNSNGCIDTAYKTIKVRGEFGIYIPNAFTPNGDGINDAFMPLMLGVKEFEMLIFDRWGLKIFETDNVQKPWDGKVEGKDNLCQNDVYVYMVKIRDVQGEMHDYTGRVSIVK
jgi:gliding motility-associated-like protein